MGLVTVVRSKNWRQLLSRNRGARGGKLLRNLGISKAGANSWCQLMYVRRRFRDIWPVERSCWQKYEWAMGLESLAPSNWRRRYRQRNTFGATFNHSVFITDGGNQICFGDSLTNRQPHHRPR